MTAQIDFEQARLNMIEQQIRTWEVLDQNVLDLLHEIHREDFVPEDYKPLALADMNGCSLCFNSLPISTEPAMTLLRSQTNRSQGSELAS